MKGASMHLLSFAAAVLSQNYRFRCTQPDLNIGKRVHDSPRSMKDANNASTKTIGRHGVPETVNITAVLQQRSQCS